jgi:high affinity sulfate transporter 1
LETGTSTPQPRAPNRAVWLNSLVPGYATLRTYQLPWLRMDLAAGLVLTAMLVPQGMAYAALAGLPPVVGLYATCVPLLAYALFGPSRILVLGPDSSLAPLVAAAVVPLAADEAERVAIASLLALMVGGLLLAGSLARLGFLTDLLSRPVRTGYLAGIAAVIIVEQTPHLLGFTVPEDNVFGDLRRLVEGLDEADSTTAAIGLGCLAVILAGRRISPVVPGVLLAVVGATIAVGAFDLSVSVLGPVPAGLPSPEVPSPSIDDAGRLALSALAIALIAFADTSVLSRSYASRHGQRVDQTDELRALGIANVATGLFQGFPVSASSSRTPVADASGARTQLAGATAALALAAFLAAGTGLLEDIPDAALAAVIIAAVLGLIDVREVARLYRVNRSDCALAVASFFGVAVFGVLPGVAIAVGLSIFAVMQRAWHPYMAVLSRVAGLKGYHDVNRHPEGHEVPGLLLFRFDAPLFFANAEVFRENLYRAMADRPDLERVVVAAEPITDVDSTAAEMLAELLGELALRNVEFGFAEMKGPVKDDLRVYGLYDRLGDERFYPTIGSAVRSHVRDHDIPWTDWEDETEEAGLRDRWF